MNLLPMRWGSDGHKENNRDVYSQRCSVHCAWSLHRPRAGGSCQTISLDSGDLFMNILKEFRELRDMEKDLLKDMSQFVAGEDYGTLIDKIFERQNAMHDKSFKIEIRLDEIEKKVLEKKKRKDELNSGYEQDTKGWSEAWFLALLRGEE